MSEQRDSIEIQGREAVVKVNGLVSKRIPLSAVVKAVQSSGHLELFPGIFPEGVKYVARRGECTVVVVEQVAMPRVVFVIAEDSPVPYGSQVKSVRRWLSFPYVYVLILFHGSALSGYQQIFYRSKALSSLNDELYICNLPNVSARGPGGLPYWFCSQYIKNVTNASWPDKIHHVLDHLWKSGWNWSSDHHEGLSQFNATKGLDKRIASFERWEKETKADPNFAVKIKWKSAGINVRKAIDKLFAYAGPPNDVTDCTALVNLITRRRVEGGLLKTAELF